MVKYLSYISILFYLVIGLITSFSLSNIEYIIIPVIYILSKILYNLIFNIKLKFNIKENIISVFTGIFFIILAIYLLVTNLAISNILFMFYIVVSTIFVSYITKKKRSIYCSNISVVISLLIYSSLILLIIEECVNYHDIFVCTLILLLINSLYKICKNINESKKNDILIMILILIIRTFKIYFFTYLVIPLVILDICINNKNKIHLFKCNKKEAKEKVSVIIPNYNYANYLKNRVQSIINQSINVDEIIIIDDASTDESEQIINEIIKEYKSKNIKYIKNSKNSKNVFEQWKKGFNLAKNNLIWICESDDLCSPYFLETVLEPMKDKDVILSYTESLAIDENDNILFEDFRNWNSATKNNRWDKSYITSGKKEITEQLKINNSINNVSGVLFRKNKNINYDKILDEAKKYKLSGDWYFYVEVLKYGKISYNVESLNYHRIHSKSITSTTKEEEKQKETKKIQKLIEEYLNKRG